MLIKFILFLAVVVFPITSFARDVTLTPDQLPGLTITLAKAGVYKIDVTATGPGGSVIGSLTVTATLPPPPPLPVPTVTGQDAEGLVGEPIPLVITATDADSVKITIPDAATLSVEGFVEGALPLPEPDVFLTATCAPGQLSAATNQAVTDAAAGKNVKITLAPCIYRETLTLQFNTKGNTGSIDIVAEQPGATIISGSDIFTGWTQDANGIWSTGWPHDFGLRGWESNWPLTLPQDELLKRVEVFFVNGVRLTQVVTFADLTDESFFIDELGDKVYIKSVTDLTATLVEGAVRKWAIFVNRASNIAIRGVQAIHATSQVSLVTAVRVQNSYNILLEGMVIRDNSGMGLSTVATNRVTSRRNQYLNNGYAGWITWRVSHLLSEDDVVMGSNWRGYPHGFWGYAVAGFKHHETHNAVYRRLIATDNLTGGMWWDGDTENVIMEDSRLCGNAIRGAFLEKIQGPLLIRGTTICDNGKWGFIVSSSQRVTLEDNVFENNGIAQINFGGGATATWSNWETGQSYSSMRTDFWTVTNTGLFASGSQKIVDFISSPTRLPPNITASGNTCETANPTAQDGAICNQ